MFFSRKKPARSYDPATQQPALRCSICTGEQVAGFISPDGHFEGRKGRAARHQSQWASSQ